MHPTVEDLELLKRIYAGGQSVHADSNVDHRPYERLQDLGWVASTTLSLPDVVYKLTGSGVKRAQQELHSEQLRTREQRQAF
ncbi:hypothetical protein [Bradyrhizobium genomosp. I (2014)]|uniref:hypothetical protein n=1 Tax=Bradyrhizobium genomosp. I (2014) TaxID=2683269 RepID=UPI00054E67F2|nr:hypothetical protein [Bradyrhizobium sp. CCBAU 43298]